MKNHDFYAVLGVSQKASLSEIKSAFRQKVKETHPDLHPDDHESESKLVAEAYAVLSDPTQRKLYDTNQKYDEMKAGIMVADIEATIRAMHEYVSPYRAQAMKSMISGVVWLLIGLTVTLISYSAASGGGQYVIMWGAILFGGIRAIRSFSRCSKIKSLVGEAEEKLWAAYTADSMYEAENSKFEI